MNNKKQRSQASQLQHKKNRKESSNYSHCATMGSETTQGSQDPLLTALLGIPEFAKECLHLFDACSSEANFRQRPQGRQALSRYRRSQNTSSPMPRKSSYSCVLEAGQRWTGQSPLSQGSKATFMEPRYTGPRRSNFGDSHSAVVLVLAKRGNPLTCPRQAQQRRFNHC